MGNKLDLVVIGGGPAGYEAVLEAAKCGMKAAIIEKDHLGGTCLNRGCVPTKTILHSVELYAEVKKCEHFGIHAQDVSYNMEEIQNRKNDVLTQLRNGIQSLMKKNKLTVYQGTGMILDKNHVQVSGENGEILETEHILIATGSVPAVPPIPGIKLPNVLTSDEMLDKKDTFPNLTIIGGGVIGMEFAAIYSALGCKVTVSEFFDRILANMDKEIAQNLKMILKKRGVDIFTSSKVKEITEDGTGKLVCHYIEKETEKEVVSDGILAAVGRRAYTEGLFGEKFVFESEKATEEQLFVQMDRGRISVNENAQTSIPNIYAAGDVTGGIMLAHAATAQAINAVMHMLGKEPIFDLKQVPGCVYTSPEIGSVGISQDEAKKAGIPVIVKKYPMSANGKSLLSDQERGFIKIVAEEETHVILGAQMMCARATDMISQFTNAIVNKQTIEQMKQVIYPHPTFSEGISEALRG